MLSKIIVAQYFLRPRWTITHMDLSTADIYFKTWSKFQYVNLYFPQHILHQHTLPTGWWTCLYVQHQHNGRWNWRYEYNVLKVMTFSMNLVWSVSLVFYLECGRRTGEVSFANNTARLFQFSVLLSWRFISHPLLLTAVGLRQPISHCHQPTWWIKNKVSSRLLFHFALFNFTCFHSEAGIFCTK